jgi:hypothetical protein
MSAALDLNRIAYGCVVAQYDPSVGPLRIAYSQQYVANLRPSMARLALRTNP